MLMNSELSEQQHQFTLHMHRSSEGQCCSAFSSDGRSVSCYNGAVKSVLTEATGQVLIVSIIGPFQRGKSSFISLLTGDRTIKIGDGINEETKGVWMYGPYSMNMLREKWGVPKVETDETEVFFVDTEGFAGDVGASWEENKLLVCKMVTPYLAISQVTILMHRSSLLKGETEAFLYFLDVAQRICTGSRRAFDGGTEIIDLSTDVGQYETGDEDQEGRRIVAKYQPAEKPEDFDAVQRYLEKIQCARLNQQQKFEKFHLQVKLFWPLPVFEGNLLLFDQPESFVAGFRLVAQRLLGVLESIRSSHNISGIGAFRSFETFQKNLKLEKLEELAEKARELGELTTAERILKSVTDKVIEDFKEDVTNKFKQLEAKMNEIPRTPSEREVNCEKLLSDALKEINIFPGITPAIRRSELWTTHIASVKSSLQSIVRKLKDSYLKKLSATQSKFVLGLLMLELCKEYDIAVAEIAEGNGGLFQGKTDHITKKCHAKLMQLKAELNLSGQQMEAYWNTFMPRLTEKCDDIVKHMGEVLDVNQEHTTNEICSAVEIIGTIVCVIVEAIAIVGSIFTAFSKDDDEN